MSSHDDIVKNSDEIQRRYEAWKAGSLTPQKPQIKEVTADQDGVDKNKVFKIKAITGEGNSDPNLAIDGKASTAFKGSRLTLELDGVGKIKAIGIKFGAKPEGPVKVQGKYDPATWDHVFDISRIQPNAFKYHVFQNPIPAQFVEITGDLNIKTVQLLDAEPGEHTEGPGGDEGPKEEPTHPEPTHPEPGGSTGTPGEGTPSPEGYTKPKGWGGSTDASGYSVKRMKDYPELFKVVDAKGVNVATSFGTEAEAKAWIEKKKDNPDTKPPEDPEGEIDDPTDKPIPPVSEESTLGPYKGTGPVLDSTQRGPTTRHYASGKDDDKTVEKNVKNIKADKYQFVVFVTMKSIEHDDNISLKYGGTHMKSGWFDHGVSFEDGQTCLGVEKKHPSTKTCVIKGPKIGSVLKKKVGVAGIYFKDQNKCELWTHLDSQGGWKKAVEGTDVADFNPKSAINEAQLRIDGFDELPDIHSATVQEITGELRVKSTTEQPKPGTPPNIHPQQKPTTTAKTHPQEITTQTTTKTSAK